MHPARAGPPQGQGLRREPVAAQAAAHPGAAGEAAAQVRLAAPRRAPFLRLVFAGTPEFAERALRALVAAGHDVALVLTQPDRPAGRGLHAVASPVKRLALAHGLPLYQPADLKAEDALARLRSAQADAMVVAAYGLLLPERALRATRDGALNIHASLLPRWRGAAPIQRAILAGDSHTGVSIMQMDVGLDTGPVLAQRAVPIAPEDDAGTLHDKLAALGAAMMVEVLGALKVLPREPQPTQGVTYAHKIDKRETQLDWSLPATALERAVRAFRPAPGATTHLDGEVLKLWRARVVRGDGAPGSVLATGDELVVACGEEALAIAEVQRAGGKRLAMAQFLRGTPLAVGTVLGPAPR